MRTGKMILTREGKEMHYATSCTEVLIRDLEPCVLAPTLIQETIVQATDRILE